MSPAVVDGCAAVLFSLVILTMAVVHVAFSGLAIVVADYVVFSTTSLLAAVYLVCRLVRLVRGLYLRGLE